VGIRVAATAVNRADLLQRMGAYPPPPGASPILGLECAGVVDAVGPGAPFAEGDRVFALLAGGGHAERVVCPAAHVLPVPPGLELVEAAALPEALATVYMALRTVARTLPGERVVAHAGASGIGTVLIQVCHAWGNPVWVTVGSQDKLRVCQTLGADGGAVRTDGPWAPALARWAPEGVDVIVDPVGQGYVEAGIDALAVGGRLVCIGLLGGTTARVDLARLLMRRLTLCGTTLRARDLADKARIVAGVAADILPHVASGAVRAVIDSVLPITRLDDAHARVRANASAGKVVLTVPGAPTDPA
jgi:putative PIG3 family NAD(P)H quinone oxidoreductase